MSQGQLCWHDVEVTWEDQDIDFYVIINAPWPGERYIAARTIVFQMEPWCGEAYQTWGVKTWGEWAAPDASRFLQVRGHRTHLNNAFWQLSATYDELRTRPIAKTRMLASICGSKYFDPGHIRRVDFLKFLEEKDDDVVRVDLYAHENPLGFKNWVGPALSNAKHEALLPYRYFFSAENNRERNFITEKLWEPLLTETLCFYWGCPNASDWVDPRAFIPIDLDNFEEAFRTIKAAMLANEWDNRLDVIRREKTKVLEYYQFFPTVHRILRHEFRLPRHPSDAEVAYHKYFHDALSERIATVAFVHNFQRAKETGILAELIASIESSGLLNRLDRLYIVNCGDEIDLPIAEHSHRIHLIDFSRTGSRGEAPTLDLIRTFVAFHDCARVLYLHTKGASHARPDPNVADWRRLMLYFLVERHAEALAMLASHDAVGCNLLDKPRRHFSGNFWWANASYLRTLPEVPVGDRHEAEWWVLGGKEARAASLYDSGIDHYRAPYDRQQYASAGARQSPDVVVKTQAQPADGACSSICLVMIVKNEAHVVSEALASMLPYIADFIVVDTGSTDGTQQTIRDFFASCEIPGQLFDRPWRDFGWNRTEALALAREHSSSDYLWMFDADDVIEGRPELAHLTAGAYHVRLGPDVEYWRLQIFQRTQPWKYIGVLHEYPACEMASPSLGHVVGDYHVLSRRLGRRSQDPHKYENDAAALEAALASDPDNTRCVFYLAQSWFDARNFDKAMVAYRRRAAMGGWPEEVFYSHYRAASCLEQLGRPLDEVCTAYEACFHEYPHRVEPLVRAATLLRLAGRFPEAYALARRAAGIHKPPVDALFVEGADYAYRALDEQAIAAYYSDLFGEAFDLCTEILDRRTLPDHERRRIEKNRDYSVPHIKDKFLRYDPELIARLMSRPSSRMPLVTLSVTSCRRLDLFVGTICSFLNACTDIDLVDCFLCVDDNSSDADREQMQRLFPFFEFIHKGPSDKGHARSLNIIREAVRTPWLVHLEDDWHFFARRPFIGAAVAIMEQTPDLGQVLFNRNYAETLDDRDLAGGWPHRSTGHGHHFVVHEHSVAQQGRRCHSNAYWPHFSLRPSVARTRVFECVGSFDETAAHFELEYAWRYVEAGWRSAFLDGVFALHTGRLTSQRSDLALFNAYDLNDEAQFGSEPKAAPSPPLTRDHCVVAERLGVKVINLDRRPDRFESFYRHLVAAAGPKFSSRIERFAAIDGRKLSLTAPLVRLFRDNDFGYRRSFVGCALSHLELWVELAASDTPAYLIFEDDVTVCNGFEERLSELCGSINESHPEFDLLLLGFSDAQALPDAASNTVNREVRLVGFDGAHYIGGLFAYIVSRRGAQRLLAIAERDGIQNGIDRFIHRKEGELELLVTTPHLAQSQLVWPASGLDSDIQNDFNVLTVDS